MHRAALRMEVYQEMNGWKRKDWGFMMRQDLLQELGGVWMYKAHNKKVYLCLCQVGIIRVQQITFGQ